MLTITISILAVSAACILVWFAVRRSKTVQRMSDHLSGPLEQMREQILLTADSAVDHLDNKIAQMEILLNEIDRRSSILAQQNKQLQMQQLQIEQQQQQLFSWFQTQRQQLEREVEVRQQLVSSSLQAQSATLPHTLTVESAKTSEKASADAPADLSNLPASSAVTRSIQRTKPQEVPPFINPSSQDKRKRILDMAEQGFSVTDIAQKMGVGKGEVMLLLKLRKKVVL